SSALFPYTTLFRSLPAEGIVQRVIRWATHAERQNDCYETPAVAVEALLRVERLPHQIWEPAAGRGAVARVLESAGHEVIGTDLIDYGAGYLGGADLLNEPSALGASHVTN